MVKAVLGKKLGMTRIFTEDGKQVPVTLIQAGPCVVMQVKTEETDGYQAVQLGFDEKKVKRPRKRKFRRALKPEIGHAKRANTTPKRFIREVPWDGEGEYNPGDVIAVAVLEGVSFVDVTGTSKGRGFAGVMKRHGFKGGKATHGQHNRDRHPGSIGQASNPSRVFKGMKMAGHMGVEKVTVQNLEVVALDTERNLLAIKGAVPGPNGGYLVIRQSIKKP